MFLPFFRHILETEISVACLHKMSHRDEGGSRLKMLMRLR